MPDQLLDLMLEQMVQIIGAHARLAAEHIGRDALDDKVMRAMRRVPRHEFVPPELTAYAYADQPLPIGFDKTTSQPFIVALMTDLLDIHPGDRVLEVGTGLGYHAAVLSELAEQVFTVEIIEELGTKAQRRLGPLGYGNIQARIGNGEYGWPQYAPFDRIVVCAASELVPPALLGQLRPGGRMVVPTGLADHQSLTLVEKSPEGRISTREILPVRFALLETAN
ncbi:MAG: protein-L-isoaspartate(D-aspartate) O-methyltransferase [Rhodospirillales bacterium]|nr:MAG: protein-L-isoaspartate(D-aspartate) O-methyltransferase [Rhodospirillales bacterium]